jgi:hypothetical protein
MASSGALEVRRQMLHLKQLELDPDNPRLVVQGRPTQQKLIVKLFEEEALDELVASFLENGYFEEEPLVVVPEGRLYRVVEGNRRLATLKLLVDRQLRRKTGVSGWPDPTPSQRRRLDPVPCVVYADRTAVLPYLGYRHITGARKWAPFQKARFVAQLLEAGQSLDEIEELIGDTSATTKKLYQDYVVYSQAVEELGIPAQRIRDRFSLLEVALGQRPIKAFLGMSNRLPVSKVDSLVSEDHLEELEEVVGWIFGTSSRLPVIGESRDISARLAKVIENQEALQFLRENDDLEGAYERTDGEQRYLMRKLAAAERSARESAGLLPIYAADDDIQAAVERLFVIVEGMARQFED